MLAGQDTGVIGVSVSIVLFQPDLLETETLLRNLLASEPKPAITVVENSPEASARELVQQLGCKYIFPGHNIGYGAGHNLAISSLDAFTEFHLICNPDIQLGPDVLGRLTAFLRQDDSIGLVMPRILYTDGSEQWLCKLLPAPLDLFLRRFSGDMPLPFLRRRLARYELAGVDRSRTREVPSLSGCFMFFRSSVLRQTGGFDPRFFLYMEDLDLCRRAGEISRTVFYPDVSVFHGYAKGSYRNALLLRYHLRSACQYFMKWGWIFDKERRAKNADALLQG